tara:strand:+ start:248 stop:460 length:213 start_codon:yes stop_codon:yes gene_type:complete
MKNRLIDLNAGTETEVDLTAEQIADLEAKKVEDDNELTQREDRMALKASAKAKLVAGEALTEDEANTIVL